MKHTTKDRKIVLELQLAADWLGSEEEVMVAGWAVGSHDGAASLASVGFSLHRNIHVTIKTQGSKHSDAELSEVLKHTIIWPKKPPLSRVEDVTDEMCAWFCYVEM